MVSVSVKQRVQISDFLRIIFQLLLDEHRQFSTLPPSSLSISSSPLQSDLVVFSSLSSLPWIYVVGVILTCDRKVQAERPLVCVWGCCEGDTDSRRTTLKVAALAGFLG